MKDARKAGEEFEKLVLILDALRGEHGCPWDKEQDEESITNYFLEEVYEAVDALASKDSRTLAEELGDVLMEIVFLARIFKEKEAFTIFDVVEGINKKMVRRHPHVFGRKSSKTSSKVVKDWNRQKEVEKERRSVFEDMSEHAPALLAAFQIGKRGSQYGFDWKNAPEIIPKVKEEISELEQALMEKSREKAAGEIGDIFFSLANISRHLGFNPELALKQTNKKFIQRFHHMEETLRAKGKSLGQATLEEMDKIWEEAKGKFR